MTARQSDSRPGIAAPTPDRFLPSRPQRASEFVRFPGVSSETWELHLSKAYNLWKVEGGARDVTATERYCGQVLP
jgi:hypothetical protein